MTYLRLFFLSVHLVFLSATGQDKVAEKQKVIDALINSGMVRVEGTTYIFRLKKASDTPQLKLMYGGFFKDDLGRKNNDWLHSFSIANGRNGGKSNGDGRGGDFGEANVKGIFKNKVIVFDGEDGARSGTSLTVKTSRGFLEAPNIPDRLHLVGAKGGSVANLATSGAAGGIFWLGNQSMGYEATDGKFPGGGGGSAGKESAGPNEKNKGSYLYNGVGAPGFVIIHY